MRPTGRCSGRSVRTRVRQEAGEEGGCGGRHEEAGAKRVQLATSLRVQRQVRAVPACLRGREQGRTRVVRVVGEGFQQGLKLPRLLEPLGEAQLRAHHAEVHGERVIGVGRCQRVIIVSHRSAAPPCSFVPLRGATSARARRPGGLTKCAGSGGSQVLAYSLTDARRQGPANVGEPANRQLRALQTTCSQTTTVIARK